MTERKRANGFALIDAAFPADRKFLRMDRLTHNPVEYAAAVGVYFLILADARRSRSPLVDFDEYSEFAPQVALLQEVRLLRSDGFDPDTFAKWAPVYRSPWDEKWVRSGTERVRSTTDTSDKVKSSTNGGRGLGEGNFLRSARGKDPENADGLWGGKGLHDGRHGLTCPVCAPLLRKPA